MNKCLECNVAIDDIRKRCEPCAHQHHMDETVRQRREKTATLWYSRNCTRCRILFKPLQGTTGGQPPTRCPDCQKIPAYIPKPIPPCSRCGCAMLERFKYCTLCRPIISKENKARYKLKSKPPKPRHPCLGCGKPIINGQTCKACYKKSRRREVARLRNFKDRLFQTLVHSPVDVDFILNLLDSPCIYCGSRENITIEHKTPLISGGAHHIDNLAPACLSCNSKKQAQTEEEFLQQAA